MAEIAQKAGTARQKRGNMNKWEKLRSLPNVHVGLHIADMVREYGTSMNCSGLSGELKHKYLPSFMHATFEQP